MNRDSIPPDAPGAQMSAAEAENDGENKPDRSSTGKAEVQSMSYQRSRNVALMKLAFLRPEDNRAA
jgi:hypothetical protein